MADRSDARRVVVLDDDPTGTQAATDVTVLLDADPAALADVLAHESAVYVQTNSRSLSEQDAVALARRIRATLGSLRRTAGIETTVVLRGDSTLRGHVFAESRVFVEDDAVLLFVPAFPEGGRTTLGGRHFVDSGEGRVPVGETEFAADPVFGFRSSTLPGFVRERAGSDATLATLDDVRGGRLAGILSDARAGAIVVADAEATDDIRAVAEAVRRAWRERPVVVRSAAPLAAELADVASMGRFDPATLRTEGAVLVVCGSHTDLARTQLSHLVRCVGAPTEIDTARALADPVAEGRRAAAAEANRRRPDGIRVVTTERDRSPEHATLAHGAAVMTALTTAAELLADDAALVVTKGGITASDVIHGSLGAQRARVRGQVQPGVSVWDVPGRNGDVRCVIVPGNMGSATVLVDVVGWARGRS